MAFNASQFCTDYSVPFVTSGTNVSDGWVGINDIYENDNSYHMGINIRDAYVKSWISGWHSLNQVIQDILGINYSKALAVIAEYTDDAISVPLDKKKRVGLKPFKISETPIKKSHGDFLRSRGFSATFLKNKYDLRSDGYNIVIPIYYNHKIISFQKRDIRSKIYRPCSLESAIMNYKDVLFNLDNVFANFVVVVEGITDNFRLGDNSVCTFGTSYTKAQSYEIARLNKHTIILFDNEKPAQKKAKKLAIELDMMGVDVEIDTTLLAECGVNDPGELSEEQSKEYMQLLLTKFG